MSMSCVTNLWVVLALILGVNATLHAEDPAPPAAGSDPVRQDLEAAKKKHQSALAEAKRTLSAAVDEKLKSVAASGNLDAVNALTAEKKALEDNGKVPTAKILAPAVSKFNRDLKLADAALSRDYDKAIKEYTKQLRTDEANAARTELAGVLAGKVGKTIDLLALIDLKKDSVAGNWSLRDKDLISDLGWGSRIRLPYQPPQEYDFRIDFTWNGPECVEQILSVGENDFMWKMGHDFNKYMGFEGRETHSSTAKKSMDIGKSYTSLVKVRKEGVTVFLDGQLVSQYKNYKELSIPDYCKIPDHALGVLTWNCVAVFHKIEVSEITGHGKMLAKEQGWRTDTGRAN